MSVQFAQETIRTTLPGQNMAQNITNMSDTFRRQGPVAAAGAAIGNLAQGDGRRGPAHQVAHSLGEALTGGDQKGTNKGYLSTYMNKLEEYPLHTRILTSGSLAAMQELLASWIARDKSKHGHFFSPRVPKMALYGAFVSAPMGHFMIKILQKLFQHRTSLGAKILQILFSNLIVSRNPLEPVRHRTCSRNLLTVRLR